MISLNSYKVKSDFVLSILRICLAIVRAFRVLRPLFFESSIIFDLACINTGDLNSADRSCFTAALLANFELTPYFNASLTTLVWTPATIAFLISESFTLRSLSVTVLELQSALRYFLSLATFLWTTSVSFSPVSNLPLCCSLPSSSTWLCCLLICLF